MSLLHGLNVSRRLVSGVIPINKFGINRSVGTSYVPVAVGASEAGDGVD